MDKFQLEGLATDDLIALRDAINSVVKDRRKGSKQDKRRGFIKSLSTEVFENLLDLNSKIIEWNSASFLTPPGLRKQRKQNLSVYLPALLRQDWSNLYPRSEPSGDFYVYAHVDPRHHIFVTDKSSGGNYGGTPFYIGKGTGNRAFDLKRNQGHGQLIRQLLNEGFSPGDIVRVLINGMSEGAALEAEAKLIYFFGTIYQSGEDKGSLLNLDMPPTPIFSGVMEKVVTSRQWNEGIRRA